MENMEIVFPRLFFTGNRLLGERVENVSRTLGDLRGIFADVDAFSRMPQNMPAYEVSRTGGYSRRIIFRDYLFASGKSGKRVLHD